MQKTSDTTNKEKMLEHHERLERQVESMKSEIQTYYQSDLYMVPAHKRIDINKMSEKIISLQTEMAMIRQEISIIELKEAVADNKNEIDILKNLIAELQKNNTNSN